MTPLTALEALQVLCDVIDGKDIAWQDIKRAKEIVRKKLEEC